MGNRFNLSIPFQQFDNTKDLVTLVLPTTLSTLALLEVHSAGLDTTAEKAVADALYAAAFATGTATSDGVIPADGLAITIDTKTYTAKTALTPTEGEVLIGGSAADFLANLKSAINHTGTPNTDYKCAAVHPTVSAGTLTATTLVLTAKSAGSGGDAIATTVVGSHVLFGNATLLRDPVIKARADAADAMTSAACDELVICRSTGGATPSGGVTPAKKNPHHAAAAVNAYTAWVTQPTLGAILKHLAVGIDGKDNRYLPEPEDLFFGGDQLSIRPAHGLGHGNLTLVFEER